MNSFRHMRLPAIVALLMPLCAAGCSGLSARPYPNKGMYTIIVPLPSGEAPHPIADGVRIQPVNVGSPFAEMPLAYKVGPSRYVTDYYNEFVVPPGRLIIGQLQDALARMGPFASVSSGTSSAQYRYLLETAVTGLYADRTDKANPAAVFEAKFILIDNGDGNYRTVFQKSYSRREPLSSSSPDVTVAGMEKAMAGVFTDLAADLNKLPR